MPNGNYSYLSEFNGRYQTWFKGDIAIMEVSKIDAVTSKSGLSQMIQGPTVILTKAISSSELVF